MMTAYHYTECGLPNVYIEGLTPMIDVDGDEVITIPFIAGLHTEIVRGIVTHEGSMSGEELRFLRTELGMTQSELAEVVGHRALTVGRWERGQNPMDQGSETVIRKLAIEKLLKPFDASIEELARSISGNPKQDGQIKIRAKADGYDLAA